MQETLKSICIPLVLAAGDILLKEWNSVSVHHFKESEDICTNLDLKVEAFLLETLMKHFPDHNFDSEEYGKGPTQDSPYTWILDPLDGTKNYIRHLPFFNISIALQHEGETIFAIVYAPKTEELFFATKGGGAWLLDQAHGEDFEMERTIRIEKSEVKDLKKAQLHVELPNESMEHEKTLKKLLEGAYRVRSFGSGAIALCYAAKGAYDGYVDLSSTSKWYDLAAGMLICEEAGLKLGTLDGKKFTDPKEQILVAAPTPLYKAITNL